MVEERRHTILTKLQGDQSYALMGLLRRRPKIDNTDSEFQALARLSLANDNDMLLERLICILPRKPNQHWSCVDDAYHVKLWDIYPRCQIAGVCMDDTVLIDGARVTWKRMACQFALHGAPYMLTAGSIILAISIDVKKLLFDISYWFQDINTTFVKVDAVYADVSSVLTVIATEISQDVASFLGESVTSGIAAVSVPATTSGSHAKRYFSTKVASIESKASSILHSDLPVITDLSSAANRIAAKISDLASDIGAAAPGIPSDVLKGEHNVIVANKWATFGEAVGIILIIVAASIFFLSPYLTRVLYRGKFWGTQSWLFGFEGYLDIETIESQIFGSRMRRLRWSEHGSSLSRHETNEFDDCVGIDPTTYPDVRQKVEDAITNTDPTAPRIFTLVDTNMMTVTLFEASRPPVAVLLCAEEGGMQRALACSYNWTTGTCYRETVLRMETPSLEQMSRVSRVRLGMKRDGGYSEPPPEENGAPLTPT
ncbi:hypothetical protein G7Y89_g1417 [Cudoniella acicularis]|uniref:Uncharacterized protein n=1 Tax=Cudoniella acicularis TaxID=354080 RepID=A0A8H4WAB2_9HELO|nr:hypothetical protein G7Y89_g1417 [Cudoniella acicularis]